MQRVDLAEWAEPVGESTGMGSTSCSAAGTVLSREEEEVDYIPQTQVANTTDPFEYQLPDLLSRGHGALLVNAEKRAVQKPLCCGARCPGWLEVTAQWGQGPVYAPRH